MTKLLLIADDLTGTLDTGIQFAKLGISTDVCLDYGNISYFTDAEVLAVDSETRHLSPSRAYEVVYSIVAAAANSGIPFIFKKTDSALRGCVGAELAAAAQALNKPLAFVPALPRLGRTTEKGIQYINGIEVAKSEFGRDPFEPVRHSLVADIIAEQADIICHANAPIRDGVAIHIFDGSTDSDLEHTACQLVNDYGCTLFAGCAGFASALAKTLPFNMQSAFSPNPTRSFAAVCGSLNPTSLKQVSKALEFGFTDIAIDTSMFLKPGYTNSSEYKRICKLTTTCLSDAKPIVIYGSRPAIDSIGAREKIADGFGLLASLWKDFSEDYTLLITGGDTLMAFMKQCGYPSIKLLCEPYPGTVCCTVQADGRRFNLVTKSGGFGSPELFSDLYKALRA